MADPEEVPEGEVPVEEKETPEVKTIPLLPFDAQKARRVVGPFMEIGKKLVTIFPRLGMDLRKSGIELRDYEYVAVATLIGVIFGALFWFMGFVVVLVAFEDIISAFAISLLLGFIGFSMGFMLYVKLPASASQKKGTDIDRDLPFALKDLLMQINSGVNLFSAMRNIAEQEYGDVSIEFRNTLDAIEGGMSFEDALTDLAIRTDSEFLGRTMWQIINTMKSGGQMETALNSMVEDISEFQKDQIVKYGKTLSVIAMVYLVFALVLPSIGVAFGLLFLSVMGFKETKLIFIAAGIAYFLFVGVMLSIVKSQKPMVF